MKSWSKTLVFAAVAAVLGCGCRQVDSPIALLEMPGQETRFSAYCGDGYFIPYTKAMQPQGARLLVTNPDRQEHLGVGFAEVRLVPDTVYEFCLRFVGPEQINVSVYGTEFAGDAERWSRPWVSTMSFLNVNGITEYRKEFAISPGTTRAIPTLFLNGAAVKTLNNLLLLDKVSIAPVGKMKHAAPEIRQINLAGKYDFAQYPAGDFAPLHKGYGKTGNPGSDVTAEVVKTPEFAALHMVRKPENYIYPYIELAPFPVDVMYHYVRVTVTAKGKGLFRTGLWWKRDQLEYDYENVGDCALTDEWKTYTMTRPCLTPGVKGASLCFYATDDGDYWIKDIKVSID